jgi:hypothetical protein
VDVRSLALEALADGRPVAADPRPSRRARYRLLAKAIERDCAVVAVVSFSSGGLIVTYGDFKREPEQWQWVGGAARDLDWDEIPPLPPGQSPTMLARSHGGPSFPAWRHVRVPAEGDEASTTRKGLEPSNGHVITFD